VGRVGNLGIREVQEEKEKGNAKIVKRKEYGTM
jgi:hypothetical protein